MRSFSYLNTAENFIRNYEGDLPFAAWIKEVFRGEKKYGSTDRKQIAHACYCWFRLGGAFKDLAFSDRLILALFLCSDAPGLILKEQKPEWNDNIHLSVEQKLEQLDAREQIMKIFPFNDQLSDTIDVEKFNRSFLSQPDLFIRVRPGKRQKVLDQLEKASIDFIPEGTDVIRLANQSKIDQVIEMDADAVIQDLNSQRTIEVLDEHLNGKNKLEVYDCCAASGGKSILVYDRFSDVRLTVTDIRASIIHNLEKRFQRAGIRNYKVSVADLSNEDFDIQPKFDLVICDAPCSGSGTWGRTPEQLNYFKKEKIRDYARLQKQILQNALKAVKRDGYLLYITCSVFKDENENQVEALLQQTNFLRLLNSGYLEGYENKADTLFVALFTKDSN